MKELRKFEVEDLEEINLWLNERDQRGLEEDELPMTGFIVPDVAAGFFYMTDSSLGFIENFVSNPDAKAIEVSMAVDEITETLLRCAVEMRLTKVFMMSKKNSILNRAEKHGFERKGSWEMASREVN